MRPVIGVSGKLIAPDGVTGVYLGGGYTNGLAEVGAIPLVIPYLEKEEDVRDLAQRLDGLLLSGGVDMGAIQLGEEPIPGQGEVCPERDWIETILFDEMQKQGKPVLGICRGMQVVNALLGGKLYQDLPSQKEGALVQHSQKAPHWYPSHHVTIEPGTLLHEVFGTERLAVNTYHHQAVKSAAPGLIVSAVADDGVIEAIERPEGDGPYLVGVQWHPELMWGKNRLFLRIFDSFVEAAKARYAAAQK
jgi:putative glutamine amidotransferase